MTPDDSKRISRRFVDDVLNQRDLTALHDLVDPDAADQLKASMMTYLALVAIPDFRMTIDMMIAEEDKVAMLSTFAGTHQGPFMDGPPSGRGVTGRMAALFRVADGKIVESWQHCDQWGLVRQIGLNDADDARPMQTVQG